jgi:hypothetical protein
MFPFRTQKRTVWLITWEYTRDDYFEQLRRRRIAAVLDSRASDDFVRRYLPLLYSTERNLQNFEKCRDMYLQSLLRYRNPDWTDVVRQGGAMKFGGHPWLEARVVDEFFIDVFDCENEVIYWTERDVYKRTPDGDSELLRPRRRVKMSSHSGETVTEKMYFGDSAIPPRKAPKPTE